MGLLYLKGSDLQMRHGTHTTVTANDTVKTGLKSVKAAVAVLESDLTATCAYVTAVVGTGGNISIKTWKPTSATDTTPIAASTFTKKVHWIAVGNE